MGKIKIGIFTCFFLRRPNTFRGPGGFCWPIGVTAALLGRLLPTAGHKLVKKKRKFRPKSAPDRPLFGRTDFLKFVWRAAVLPEATVDLKYLGASRSCQGPELGEDRLDEEHSAPWQRGILGNWSYRWCFKNRPYKVRLLHTNFWT